MLSPDEHPGIFTFMVGIVVIVMVAIGLSVLMDKKFASSSGGLRLEREIETLAEEVTGLRDRVDGATSRMAGMEGSRGRAIGELREVELRSEAAIKRKEELLEVRDEVRDAIITTEREFADYRSEYRQEERIRAVGESLGTLTLRDGRDYRDASITKVTDVGLEIRHEHGFARIHAPDLGEKWQDRFQWDDEERRTRLNEEALARARMAASKVASVTSKPKKVATGKVMRRSVPVAKPEDSDKVVKLRLLYSAWRSKVSRLESETNEAISNSMRQTSVPGRLETWGDRARRLRGELSKARIELASARGRLEAVSPRDPLLIVERAGGR